MLDIGEVQKRNELEKQMKKTIWCMYTYSRGCKNSWYMKIKQIYAYHTSFERWKEQKCDERWLLNTLAIYHVQVDRHIDGWTDMDPGSNEVITVIPS